MEGDVDQDVGGHVPVSLAERPLLGDSLAPSAQLYFGRHLACVTLQRPSGQKAKMCWKNGNVRKLGPCPWGFGVLWDKLSDDTMDLITFWPMQGSCVWAPAGVRPQGA